MGAFPSSRWSPRLRRREPSDEPVLTFHQRFKSPKAASNLQFERPWDPLVPAKSVKKLTVRLAVSKEFLRG
ncbi:MAG: hypothetical protein DME91_00375 [Verrucomicrobia bacterium]|nr:MAG: hypothetical protein DME91_00375 [Verrucomicrobiota bacterium]PYJ49039.1 MAG: hypothetical protein DME85_00995 [Verrucomicrobiota bacterium]